MIAVSSKAQKEKQMEKQKRSLTIHGADRKVLRDKALHLNIEHKLLKEERKKDMATTKTKAAVDVRLAAVAVALRVKVKMAAMPPLLQAQAFRCARHALDAMDQPGKPSCAKVAFALKQEFDECYGPAWHCIVGTSFGSFVTHSFGGFLYFSVDKLSILLFKTTLEPVHPSF